MPHRDDRGYTQEERQVLIVGKLFTSTRKVFSVYDLLTELDPYSPRPGQSVSSREQRTITEKLRTDLRLLEGRGMVERVPLSSSPVDAEDGEEAQVAALRADGIRYAWPRKSRALYLTGEEHAALGRARRALGEPIALTSPFAAEGGRPLDLLDQAGVILRYLEESGDVVNVKDLATYLGCDNRRVRSAIDILERVDDNAFNQTMFVAERDTEDGPVQRVRLQANRQSRPGMRVGGGGGLNPHGRFEYTLPEVHERLAMIHRALGTGLDLSEADRDLLLTASAKLNEWAMILEEVHAANSAL